MIVYRPYRNNDPPVLMEVWNEAATGRGAYPIRTPAPLERWIFSKPYFDPNAMIIAEEVVEGSPKRIVGFSLSGFGPNDDHSGPSQDRGFVCCVLVRPSHRHLGIGGELVRRGEQYLIERGAKTLVFGSQWPTNPHLFGLYGGSNSPGVLESDADAKPFIEKHGYAQTSSMIVFQRKLDIPLTLADSRFNLLRKRYDINLLKSAAVASWWQECVWSSLEPAEFRVMDKLTGFPAARAIAWELEGFNWKWNAPSAGIIDVQVRPDLRKLGIAKMLLTHVLRFLQDQFFGIAELQVRADDPAAIGLCKSVGFEPIDIGHVYEKPVTGSPN